MPQGGQRGGRLRLDTDVTELAKSDLAEDLERARDIAEDVTDTIDGTCAWAANKKGYKVTVPFNEEEDDDRIILVRVMARSSARDNYSASCGPERCRGSGCPLTMRR